MAKAKKKAVRRTTSSSAKNPESSYIIQFGVVFIVIAAIVIAYIVGMKMGVQ